MSRVNGVEVKEGNGIKEEEGKRRRGRKPKDYKEKYQLNKDQVKFFVDLSKENEELELVFSLLEKVNQKDLGKDITFKDVALFGISKITDKDIEKIQEKSLSDLEKVERLLKEYNRRNGTSLELGEFLVKKLSIS